MPQVVQTIYAVCLLSKPVSSWLTRVNVCHAVENAVRDTALTYTSSTQWASASVFWGGILGAGTHTAWLQSPQACHSPATPHKRPPPLHAQRGGIAQHYHAPHRSPQFGIWSQGIGLWGPIPASQCNLHSVTPAAQWWSEPTLLSPSVARGLCPRHRQTCGGAKIAMEISTW